jgi:hypothetical protein
MVRYAQMKIPKLINLQSDAYGDLHRGKYNDKNIKMVRKQIYSD